MATKYYIVKEDKEFKFKKLCPYCNGNLTYICNGWEQADEDGLYIADTFDVECSNEPKNTDSDEWNFWLQQHSDMPYVHQLPIDEQVKQFINERYRFKLIE